jgi:hypothetical protein
MTEEGISRRSLITAVGTSVALAGCLGSFESAPKRDSSGNETTPQLTDRYGVELSVPDDVRTWEAVSIVDTAPPDIDGTVTISDDDTTTELDLTERYVFETPGQYRIEVSLAVAHSAETWTDSLSVSYPTPDVLSEGQFETILAHTDRQRAVLDVLTEDGRYTADSSAVFEQLGEYATAGEHKQIHQLSQVVAELTDRALTQRDTAYIGAIRDSEPRYEEILLSYGLGPASNVTLRKMGRAEELRRFEEELYDFEGVLNSGENGLTDFDETEDPDQMREELFDDFVSMRDTMLPGGLSERQREYLETAASYIEERKIKANPRWEQARETDLWADGIEQRNGELTESELQAFQTNSYTTDSSHDAYPDAIKEHVLEVAPTENVSLLYVEHTESVDTERSRKLLETMIDYMAEEYGINNVAVEGETDAAPIDTTSEWDERLVDRIDDLSSQGMHHVYFTDGFASAAGIASRGDGANYGLVDMDYDDNDFIKHTIAHELGHMYGLWGDDGNEWIHSECGGCVNGCDVGYGDEEVSASAADESYMSYCGDDEGSFIEADLTVMRTHEFEQRQMDMGYLDELLARGETLESNVSGNIFWPDRLR